MEEQQKVLVPALVGLDVAEASELAFEARVVVVAAGPDELLPLAGVVTAQTPQAGTQVEPAAVVEVLVDPGGGGGGGGRRVPTPPPGPLDPAGTK